MDRRDFIKKAVGTAAIGYAGKSTVDETRADFDIDGGDSSGALYVNGKVVGEFENDTLDGAEPGTYEFEHDAGSAAVEVTVGLDGRYEMRVTVDGGGDAGDVKVNPCDGDNPVEGYGVEVADPEDNTTAGYTRKDETGYEIPTTFEVEQLGATADERGQGIANLVADALNPSNGC